MLLYSIGARWCADRKRRECGIPSSRRQECFRVSLCRFAAGRSALQLASKALALLPDKCIGGAVKAVRHGRDAVAGDGGGRELAVQVVGAFGTHCTDVIGKVEVQ